MAEENEIELAAQPSGNSKIKLIVYALVGLLVTAGATFGALYAMGMLRSFGGAGEAAPAAEAEQAQEQAEAVYVSLDPAFTVNFNRAGDARYLQLTLEAMTRDPDVEYSLKRHMPVIRNDLMLLFSGKSPQELQTRQGKEALQAETLAGIQRILERETGSPGVEAIYFTSFVMQ